MPNGRRHRRVGGMSGAAYATYRAFQSPVGDPLIDQFQAGQNSTPTDSALAQRLWARAGGQLLDRIGPAILMVHSAGGPFSWLVANERPGMVKAILNVEGASPLFAAAGSWPLTAVPLQYDPPVTDPAQFATKEAYKPMGR